jgi:hypothetical protein
MTTVILKINSIHTKKNKKTSLSGGFSALYLLDKDYLTQLMNEKSTVRIPVVTWKSDLVTTE